MMHPFFVQLLCNIYIQKIAPMLPRRCNMSVVCFGQWQGKEVAKVTDESKNSISRIMEKALKTKVTQQVKDDIASVLAVSTDKMTARQAGGYAQIAKAIKGDKSAFEAVSNMYITKPENEKAYSVEIKVVE